ncbi:MULTISPECIES: 5-deoxy-glucuronate isomerase [unclassified Marinobacterium]|uniref:5-deoxy-glucuronate isomerase n=1 Tax=unclassified Marinobacterium TaxID=2644139 RepID=UPI0015694891|nr:MULTISPECIES: 5-deoxy-glucuronate isomerase [unclassified Marinobacterium]NRP53295.1 5-deoxy-glucuronate isomerase [Marinobacterium sp. xm-v-242]NRP78080.1 5-deoxy-glucuronate isomerase [Marinobacterium sp. xm-m-383]
MHIAPFENHNQPIVDVNDERVPLNYFNIVKLKLGEAFNYSVPGYETCIVPATGRVTVSVSGQQIATVGLRSEDVWDAEPEGVYVPTGQQCSFVCESERAEVFIAGAPFDEVLQPFAVFADDIDMIQYGSDDTKTHRKIKHILGQKQADKVGRLLVSELFTVGTGGWSGFPAHKHGTDREGLETKHDETYNFRFKPNTGSALQLLQKSEDQPGEAFHVVDGSTFVIDDGYHPCVVMPGYQMYYFTILGGAQQRGLAPYFQPIHADQLDTIPGMKSMWSKFK